MFYDTIGEAKEVGMKKSKKNLKGYSIFKRNSQHKDGANKFYIVGEIKVKCHDCFQFYCHNYNTPFEVKSTSPKSGLHIDMFPTVELADIHYNELLKENYRTDIYKKY